MELLSVGGVDLTGFLGIPYNALRHPASESIEGFLAQRERGANCELFSLAFWWAAGFYVEPKRSIELWHDSSFTIEVSRDECEIFDIFFFLPKGVDPHKVVEDVLHGAYKEDLNDLKKFHLAVYIGPIAQYGFSPCLLHLPKPGPSCIWPFESFVRSPKEYWLFKIKRPQRLKPNR